MLPKDQAPLKLDKRQRERELEEGLDETFPASDAVSILEPAPRDKDKKS